MKAIFALILFFNFSITSFGQNSDRWSFYYNPDSSLIGFKDAAGKVKIAPEYSELTRARYFDHVIVVFDSSSENKFRPHFLTKSGKNFGYDSVYFFDNMPDCENEDFIRFRNQHSDKMGLFNREGRAVIPAKYNYISSVKNGFVVALKNAKKMTDGEHFFYQGGQTILIDTNNVILSQDTILQHIDWNKINFYSFKKSSHKINDRAHINIQDIRGNYYGFTDYREEFQNWLLHTYLPQINNAFFLKENCFRYVISNDADSNKYIKVTQDIFLSRYAKAFKNLLSKVKNFGNATTILQNEIDYFYFVDDFDDQFHNNCDELKDWKYPTFTVYATNQNDLSVISHIAFIRTDNGYKLFYCDFGNSVTN